MNAETETPPEPRRWTLWLPLILFACFLVLVLIGLLRPASHDIPSQMIGKPLPQFSLPPAVPQRPGLATGDFVPGPSGGKARLLNIFASWCVPCAVETPQLAKLAKQGVEIDGIAIRDRRSDVEAFLARYGDPYTRIGVDDVSAVQLAIGSSGVPESFIIDRHGKIFYQHIGVIRPDQVSMILAKLKEAGQ